ncbi:MAG TPA: gliding motility-associated C-terminal domain-containing protein [Bacteroidales bacterium]|nr:gliding motility-associated C-terminal domain-containing protein [Bacteroidales bacterium]
MSSTFSNIVKWLFATVAVFVLTEGNYAFSQRNISGPVINAYTKVTAVGSNSVTGSDVSAFAANDTVLLIQMAGVVITANPLNPSTDVGELQDTLGSPGKYEFLIISSINSGTKTITFTQPSLSNTYDPEGKVQLIRVPSYNDATVTSTLTCAPWDSSACTGGVLAIMVKRKLTLNATINVSEKGFKGGLSTQGPGICANSIEASDYRLNFYDASSTISGLKGDGVGNKSFNNPVTSDTYPGSARGMAPSFSGGGGGNGHYSGGGGGSSYGAGYLDPFIKISGGSEVGTVCPFPFNGAYGGHSYNITELNNGLFMGGGGGASTYNITPSVLSNGGNGGGIIFIMADTLVGNGQFIYANGGDAAATTINGNAGSGGGGGAGTIVIQTGVITSYPFPVANGGKGGNNINSSGGTGGGGGGGLIYANTDFTGKGTVYGGHGGYIRNTETPENVSASNGHDGLIWSDLQLNLNGFLFNSVYSRRTRTTSELICQNTIPSEMIGTQPTGGNGTYSFQWQRSADNITYSDITTNGTSISYTPVATETSSVYFRRKVTSNGLTDYSQPVYVEVQPAITGNSIGSDNTICYNQDPVALNATGTIGGGDGSNYAYSWRQSTDNLTWSAAEGTSSTSSYDPGKLTQTLYYKRVVNSGVCTAPSNIVTINVLPLISNNTVTSDQTVCQGTAFSALAGSQPSGGAGAGSYSYNWQESADKISWSAASGTYNAQNYTPSSYAANQTYYFRREVISGPGNVCRDTSANLTLVRYPSISGNTISSSQTQVCAGTIINDLTGDPPSGGAGYGSYTFQWQRSTDGTTWNPTGKTTQNMAGEQVSTTTYFNRVVSSSVCPASTSNSVMITSFPVLVGYEIAIDAAGHDTILAGTAPAKIKGATITGGTNAYTRSWAISTDGVNYSDLGVSTADYQPGALTTTTWFRRTVISGPCTEISIQRITVLQPIASNTISGNQYICSSETPASIQGTPPTGGAGVGSYKYLWQMRDTLTKVWSPATGTNNLITYSPSLLNRDTEFRRIVTSGENNCCTDTSLSVTIQIDVMPESISAGDDVTLLPYQFATTLNGSFTGKGTGEWTVDSSDGDPLFADNNDPKTIVTKLGFGENILKWRVTNNKCIAEPDYVTINVPKVNIPEGISPNNDGINDYFDITGLEFTTNELVIINTGGAVVYKTKNYRSDDPANAWYGIDNNGDQLPEGTYYFLLTITGATDSSIPHYVAHLSGFIIIRR